MDRRERDSGLVESILMAQEGHQSSIWTALPGIIQSFDPVKKTCTVQPTIQAQVMAPDGTVSWMTITLLVDCPVQFPSGGGFTLTFPLAQGDECLVVFSSRCIDAWWERGGVQAQAELRMHSLSDGFVIPGISSVPAVPADISASEVHLRNAAGTRKLRLSATELEVLAPGASVKLSDGRVDITGSLVINGEPYVDHVHTSVTSGPSNTGPKA